MANIGQIIENKYEILKRIGKGGMSEVYLAMDRNLNKQWAVKEIKKKAHDKNNEVVIQSAIAEANMMKKLDHPCLPRIVDIIDRKNVIYVVMDYIEGEPLSKILEKYGAQPQETARNWLFLVPENPYKKVWFSVLAGVYGTAVDLIPGMITATVIMGEQPGIMILWYLTFLIVDFLYSQVGLLMEALIPVTSMDVVKSMIQMILRCLILVVLSVLVMIGYFAWGIAGALILTCIASAGIGGVIFWVYPWMLHRGK